jgi:hypothetical protein
MTTDSRPNTFAPYDETSRRALICETDPAMQKTWRLPLRRPPQNRSGGVRRSAHGERQVQPYDFVIVNERFGLNPRGENEASGFSRRCR